MRTVIIDGTNLFMMSYFANRSVDNNGAPYGGAKGVLLSLRNIINETKADKVIFVWDGAGGSTKKKQMYSEYKAGRKPMYVAGRNYEFDSIESLEKNKQWQMGIARAAIDMLPVCQIVTNGFEADDAISYIILNSKHYGFDSCVLVSSDKDFYQLVTDRVLIYNRANKQVVSKQSILQEYNITPENWIIAKTLSGDNSDNIQGVKGVGFKTAAKLFPLDEKPLTLEDVKQICETEKQQKKHNKKYDLILEDFSSLEQTYKLMNLKDVLISLHDKQSLDYQIMNFSPSLKTKDFYLYLMKLAQRGIIIDTDFLDAFNRLRPQ